MPKLKSVRESFVKHFSESAASLVEKAAESHANWINSENKGDDPFKWAILIVIGYGCIRHYRDSHGIPKDFTWNKFKQWVKRHGKLDTHNGDCEYLSLLAGVYTEFINPRSQKKRRDHVS